MLKKSYSKTGKSCRVTFKLPADLGAEEAAVLGEWNSWSADTHPMVKRKDGSLSTTISLEAGQEYRFRYLLDGERWQNDDEADSFVYNRFGSRDCVITV
ncbi:MAG: isoamylase early set domain-containing protein [Holophagales bacterium]|nr:isoamylase early set domain-containing protein [Holophagales bacterium]